MRISLCWLVERLWQTRLLCCFVYSHFCLVIRGMEPAPFEEEDLMKKWQEILGPSNEVVVSVFFFHSEFLSPMQQYLAPGHLLYDVNRSSGWSHSYNLFQKLAGM